MLSLRQTVISYLIVAPNLLFSQSSISLNKLSDCNGLAKTVTSLRTKSSGTCRGPQNAIENKLMFQFGLLPNVRACLLSEAPSQLDGFTCIKSWSSGASELTCFRAASAAAMDTFVRLFDSQSSDREAAYEKSAKACAVGNGHFATVQRALFPKQFEQIANPRFGFGLGIDSSPQMHGEAYHGFADVDSAIIASPRAIEIFDVFQTDQVTKEDENLSSERVKSFSIETDNLEEFTRQYKSRLRDATGFPIVAKARLILLKYHGSKDVDISKRRTDLESWEQGISSGLTDAGFRNFTDKELANSPIRSVNDLRDLIVKNTPPANRKFSADTMGPHLVLLTTDNERCQEGAFGFTIEPVPDVKTDYGGFVIILLGIGHCLGEDAPSGVLSDDRLDEIVEYLKGQL
jgi:hypothetical protein